MGLSLYGFFFLSSCGSCLNHQLWWWIFWVSKSENLCNQPGGDDDDLAVILLVMGYMHRFVTQWAGFWLTALLQFCRWEISQHLSCNKLHKSLKCLLQVEKLMVLMTGWMLDWVFENQETHHWHEFLSVFLVSEFVGFLLVADVYMSRWMSFFAGDLIFELVEMFWKQAQMWVLTHSSLLQDLLSMWGLGSAQQSTELVSSLGCAGDSQYLLEEQGRDLQPAQSFCQVHKLFLFTR